MISIYPYMPFAKCN